MASLRQPSLLALRAFEAAASRLSFTAAAEQLHISQAAVSRHVRLLERDLGTSLFRRLHRRVELTATGRKLAKGLTKAFQEIERAVDTARNSSQPLLRVTTESAFAALWLVPRLDSFANAHPNIELNLETSLDFKTLGRDADVAIRYLSTLSRKRWRGAQRLLHVECIPVIGKAHRRSPGRSDDEAVLDYRLLHDDDGTAWRCWFAASGLTGYERLKHATFNDHSLALDAARRGHGVVLGTPLLIERELASGALQVVGTTKIPLGDYWLLQASDRASAAARRVFVQWLAIQANGEHRTR